MHRSDIGRSDIYKSLPKSTFYILRNSCSFSWINPDLHYAAHWMSTKLSETHPSWGKLPSRFKHLQGSIAAVIFNWLWTNKGYILLFSMRFSKTSHLVRRYLYQPHRKISRRCHNRTPTTRIRQYWNNNLLYLEWLRKYRHHGSDLHVYTLCLSSKLPHWYCTEGPGPLNLRISCS